MSDKGRDTGMKNKALIKDLSDIISIIGWSRDMFKENYDKDIVEMIRDIIKGVKSGKYEK